MKEYFILRNNQIHKANLINETKNGSWWCKIEGITKKKLVSAIKIFETLEEARKELDYRDKRKNKI